MSEFNKGYYLGVIISLLLVNLFILINLYLK